MRTPRNMKLVRSVAILLAVISIGVILIKPRNVTRVLNTDFHGRVIIHELDSDGIDLKTFVSAAGGDPYMLPASAQLSQKPTIDTGEGRMTIRYEGQTFTLEISIMNYLWLPSKETLFMAELNQDKGSRLGKWSPTGKYKPLTNWQKKDLMIASVSLDEKYILTSFTGHAIVYSIDGKENFKPNLPDHHATDLVMLSRNEFLLPILFFNQGYDVRKWLVKEQRLETLGLPGWLTSVEIYGGRVWAHRHEGRNAVFDPEKQTTNEFVKLSLDLKSIEQAIPLPKGIERLQSR